MNGRFVSSRADGPQAVHPGIFATDHGENPRERREDQAQVEGRAEGRARQGVVDEIHAIDNVNTDGRGVASRRSRQAAQEGARSQHIDGSSARRVR